jgi:hypothetical protein
MSAAGGPKRYEVGVITDTPMAYADNPQWGAGGYFTPADQIDDGGYACARCGRTKADAQVNGCTLQDPCPMVPTSPVLFIGSRAISLGARRLPGTIRIFDPLIDGEVTYTPTEAPLYWHPRRRRRVRGSEAQTILLIGAIMLAAVLAILSVPDGRLNLNFDEGYANEQQQ